MPQSEHKMGPRQNKQIQPSKDLDLTSGQNVVFAPFATTSDSLVQMWATQLGNGQLHEPQQHALIKRMGQVHGNQHVQRVIEQSHVSAPSVLVVQRRNGGGSSGGSGGMAGAISAFQAQESRAQDVLMSAYGSYIRAKKDGASFTIMEVDDATIKTWFAEYHIRHNHIHPRKKRPWKLEDAKELGRLDGFADAEARMIYINRGSSPDAKVATMVHEMLHMYAAPSFRALGADLDEGATERFTLQACKAKGISVQAEYRAQRWLVDDLAQVIGEGGLVQAYFGGAPVLSKLLDVIMGSGSFEKMMQRLKEGDLSGVESLLKPHRASNWIQKMIKIIKGRLGGWVSDEDIDAIRTICGSVSEKELAIIREEIAPLVTTLWSHGQRAELRIVLGF
jgi:hypothetical protein